MKYISLFKGKYYFAKQRSLYFISWHWMQNSLLDRLLSRTSLENVFVIITKKSLINYLRLNKVVLTKEQIKENINAKLDNFY